MKLTKEQVKSVERGEPLRIASEEVGEDVVVIRSDLYDRISELLEDWDLRLMRQHVAKMMEEDWGEPEMSVYDR